jgi:hypothetical protein
MALVALLSPKNKDGKQHDRGFFYLSPETCGGAGTSSAKTALRQTAAPTTRNPPLNPPVRLRTNPMI